MRPSWIRLLVGAGLLAVLTAVILQMVGSPLRRGSTGEGRRRRLWQQVHPVAAGGCSRHGCWSSWSRPRPTRSFSREGRLFSDLLAALVYLAVLFTIVSMVFGCRSAASSPPPASSPSCWAWRCRTPWPTSSPGSRSASSGPTDRRLVWLDGPVEGEVVQINWRSVQIRTAGNDWPPSPTAWSPSRASSIAACRRRGGATVRSRATLRSRPTVIELSSGHPALPADARRAGSPGEPGPYRQAPVPVRRGLRGGAEQPAGAGQELPAAAGASPVPGGGDRDRTGRQGARVTAPAARHHAVP